MGWFGRSRQPAVEELTDQQKATLKRKCAMFKSALEGCRRANPDQNACAKLALRLVTCYAEDHAKQESVEHRRCYTSLYKSGSYKGQGHCIPYEDAMKAALEKKKLYPV